MDQIKVIQVGLGPLGQKIVQFINQRKGIKVIGAVDVAPDLTGKDMGLHCGGHPDSHLHRSVPGSFEGSTTGCGHSDNCFQHGKNYAANRIDCRLRSAGGFNL